MKVVLIIVGVIAVGSWLFSSHGSDSKSAASTTEAPASNISVVADKSTCVSTGIDDAYTGDGKVLFAFTLRNSGAAGTVNVTPVRHYSDGDTNMSGMDTMLDVAVPAHSTKRFSSQQMTYKAHEHEVVSCGLMLDDGNEIPIAATGI